MEPPSHAGSRSQDARHAAEEEIYTNLNQKIDQFLQLADYDWMALEPGSRASDYLVDLIGFLRSTFAVFTHLPVSQAAPSLPSAPGSWGNPNSVGCGGNGAWCCQG